MTSAAPCRPRQSGGQSSLAPAAAGGTSSARTWARIHHNITSAGAASTVLMMKKVGQPMVSASTPASGPTHTRPIDEKALISAYPDRFLVGSDTWVNARWSDYENLMSAARLWLGDLPPAVAQQVAWGNAAALFEVATPR